MSGEAAYLPGRSPANPGPLARYLPPIPEGVVADWLMRHAPVGSWVLDPFGAAPRLTVEAARAGYRVLVAANNPVARFLIEMAADPPSEVEMSASLAELAAAYKGEERIEPHIRSLYETECTHCNASVTVEAFLWERGAQAPYARIYHCPQCGEEGEQPVNAADVTRAMRFATGGLHRARALERIAPPHDPDRDHAEEALSVYIPRTVYALFTLINKLDGLKLLPPRRKHLEALLLSACDRANTLWAYPTARERPRQLKSPPRFRENNVWLSLEGAIPRWGTEIPQDSIRPLPLSYWPDHPPANIGITLFEGRLKDLTASLGGIRINAVLAPLPRPNQAFWTLSALWAGWLWGREAVGPFKSVLRRRRYDWAWHTTALYAAFSHLTPILSPDTPVFGAIGELETGFITAALIAADAAGFTLQDLAIQPDNDQAQITWGREVKTPDRPPDSPIEVIASQSAISLLDQRSEPTSYPLDYAAALQGIAQARVFRAARLSSPPPETRKDTQLSLGEIESVPDARPSPGELFTSTVNTIKETLTYRGGFLRYGASETAETGQVWLRESRPREIPLSDRVEMALVRFLYAHPGCTLDEIEFSLYETFPGLLTPSAELVYVCLDSYGERVPPKSDHWQLRPEDTPAARRADLKATRALLAQLGERLGFTLLSQDHSGEPEELTQSTGRDSPLYWVDVSGNTRYAFFPIASAVIGEILLESDTPVGQGLIVLPGGRANLVAYKLKNDPRLSQLCDPEQGGWRFLKFRHLRFLIENPLLTSETLDEQLGLDPLTYTTPQMRLL